MFCDFCNMKGHSRENCYKLMHCEFCKMKDHLKENCYKIIGYPADFKGKKKANAVIRGNHVADLVLNQQQQNIAQGHHVVNTEQQQGNGQVLAPFFTTEQYNQILTLLNKSQVSEASANMAGKNLSDNLNVLRWIVDTGATNHMINDESALKNGVSVGNSGKVQLPNGESASITQVGDYHLAGGSLHWEGEGDW
uniref:Uncharacterized protein LOC104237134 isoform X1 n=1 Tax=Nicotiana sylvestris TaxID=4096 RepID=A0A1U7XRK0_NICSY|nr:PREDICTED: uncharacterized protein LOC104237134 isoform X1 [Nicotiana sylvestris]